MCEHINAFDFPNEIFKGTKKLELNLDIEFGRAVLLTASISRRKLWNILTNACPKRRGRNHPIKVIPSGVKKSSYKDGVKIVVSRFSYTQPLVLEDKGYKLNSLSISGMYLKTRFFNRFFNFRTNRSQVIIWSANQWAAFYIIGTSVVKQLILETKCDDNL